jgi:hypothetical protein
MTASFTVLLGVAVLLWIATVANAISIRSSDAAGNALSQAFGVLMAIALFVLLALVLVLGVVRGEMPAWMRVALVVLVPASGAATVAAIEVLSQGTEWPVKWPLIVPILAPLILIVVAVWSYSPSLRAMTAPRAIGGVATIVLAGLSIAPWPLLRERTRVRRAGPGELAAIRAAKRARWSNSDSASARAQFEALEPDAPLYSWLPFTEPGHPLRDRAMAAIARLPDKQREVEEMVRSGNVAAVREIPNLGVEATQSLCDAASESIVFHARRSLPDSPTEAAQYARYARDVEFYMPAVVWLVDRGCPIAPAIAELETTARAFGDSPERARFLNQLAQLKTRTRAR